MFTFAFDLGEDLLGGLGPDERMLATVPAGDELPAGAAHQQLDLVVPDQHATTEGELGVDTAAAVDAVGFEVDGSL